MSDTTSDHMKEVTPSYDIQTRLESIKQFLFYYFIMLYKFFILDPIRWFTSWFN